MSIEFFNEHNYWGQKAEDIAREYVIEDMWKDETDTNVFITDIEHDWTLDNITKERISGHLNKIWELVNASKPNPSQPILDDYLINQQRMDFDDAMLNLTSFFDHENKHNPSATNTFLVKGEIDRWDGKSSGISPEDSFADIFKSRPGTDYFKDCEITNITVDGRNLKLEGHHHDGGVYLSARQLTDKGQDLFCENIDYMGYLPEEPVTIDGKEFEDGDELEFLNHLYENYTENIEEAINNY